MENNCEKINYLLKRGREWVCDYNFPPESKQIITFMGNTTIHYSLENSDNEQQLLRFHQAFSCYEEALSLIDLLLRQMAESGLEIDYPVYLKTNTLKEFAFFLTKVINVGHLKHDVARQHIYGERSLTYLYEAEFKCSLLYSRYRDIQSGVYSAELSKILYEIQVGILDNIYMLKDYLINVQNFDETKLQVEIEAKKQNLTIYQQIMHDLLSLEHDKKIHYKIFTFQNAGSNVLTL